MRYVVYLILNTENGKMYVGQTKRSLEARFNEHSIAETVIGRAIRCHGAEKFRYGVIKTCASKAEADAWEKFFIAALRCKVPNGYNCTDGGEGGSPCDETRAKIAAAKMGRKNPNYGKHHSAEHCAKISAKMSVVMLGNKNNLGNHHTATACAKISAALSGVPKSSAHRAKLSEANKGKHHATTTRTKISAAQRGYSPFKNLLSELDARQLTYNALAKLMGLPRTNLSCRIRGERNFTAGDKVKLVEIFGKPIEYLLARDDG